MIYGRGLMDEMAGIRSAVRAKLKSVCSVKDSVQVVKPRSFRPKLAGPATIASQHFHTRLETTTLLFARPNIDQTE